MTRIANLLERRAADRPGAIALVHPRETLTFETLFQRTASLADALRRSGIGSGDVVAVSPANGVDVVVGAVAAFRCGAVPALLPAGSGRAEWTAVRDAVAPRVWIGSESDAAAALPDPASAAALDAPGITADSRAYGLQGEPAVALPGGTALLKFTSGSTGSPKGIALTEANLLAEAAQVRQGLGLREGERILAPVPLTHSYGFDLGVLPLLETGAVLEIAGPFVPRRLLNALGAEPRALFLGVPSLYRYLIEVAEDRPAKLEGTRWFLSCTAPLHPPLVAEFARRFGVPICQHYGSSETGAAANHVPSEALRRPEAVGRALPGVTIEIVDEKGSPAAPGAEGEIEIRGDAVSPGYALAGPDERSRLRGGSFRTRDLGRLDADGFLTVLGRMDDVINVGGFKVFPSEVARVLQEHPSVREAAVVGIRDEQGQEFVAAAVTLRGVATEAELVAGCRAKLAEHKVPRRIDIRAELPRTAAGKVRLRAEDFAR